MFEYFTHRFVFHSEEHMNTRCGFVIHFVLHGYHHMCPGDTTRITFPPLLAWVVTYLVFRVYSCFINMDASFMTLAGGYLCYDLMHASFHNPKTKHWFRWLRVRHKVHHYSLPVTNFGVSTPFLDYVFQTNKK
jgi:4-hydroxysphinganine ceramide fatty acyl 2-hydroxylase